MNRQGARDARIDEPTPELDALARQVLKAAVEVHRVLGPGFLESVYEAALCAELSASSIPFLRQVAIRLEHKGSQVGEGRIDLLVDESLVVELKAVERLLPIHFAQVISYLKATRRRLGLLVNFNVPVLLRSGVRRVVLSNQDPGDPGALAVHLSS